MNKYLHLHLILLVYNLSIAQPVDIEEQDIDSVLTWMETNYNNDSNDFQQIAIRTIQRAEKGTDYKLLGQLHQSLADWHGFHGFTLPDSTLYHMYKAIDYSELINDKPSIAALYSTLSIDLLNADKLEKSQAAAFKAIGLFEELDDEGGLANCHRSLTYLFDRLNEQDKAEKYGVLAYNYYKKVADYDLMSYTLLSLIGTYNALENYEKAQDAAQECIDLVNNKIPEQVFVIGRAYSYKSDVSLKEGKLDQALRESIKSYDIVRKEVGDDRAASYRDGIGNVYFAKKEWSKALPHYLAGIVQSDKQGIDFLFPVYKKIADCYKNLGQHEKALNYYDRYAEMKIKRQEETIANLETEMVIKYETGKKDEAIAYQETELKQKAKTQKIYIGIMALLGALLSGLYYLYRKTKQISADLKVKNAENEVLMKEIHHRVKNNLQILSSLLSLQSDSEEDESIVDALQESRGRVESMSLIHQKLYTKDKLTSINMKEYVRDLCSQLKESFDSTNRTVLINQEVSIELADVETAIPLGLILNELITNSMKYAFNDANDATINVRLWEDKNIGLCLEVSDNGNSASTMFTSDKSTKFGSRLIDILCKKLKGTMIINKDGGYTSSLTFTRYELS